MSRGREKTMIAIILVIIAFIVIWHYATKEQEDLDDAISKMDDYDDYNY